MEICSVASLKWLFKDCSFCYLYSIDFTSHTQGLLLGSAPKLHMVTFK